MQIEIPVKSQTVPLLQQVIPNLPCHVRPPAIFGVHRKH
jgi:hypothetical protein